MRAALRPAERGPDAAERLVVESRCDLAGALEALVDRVAERLCREALQDPLLPQDPVGLAPSLDGQQHVLVNAAANEALVLEPGERLACGRTRDAEDLRDVGRKRRCIDDRAALDNR